MKPLTGKDLSVLDDIRMRLMDLHLHIKMGDVPDRRYETQAHELSIFKCDCELAQQFRYLKELICSEELEKYNEAMGELGEAPITLDEYIRGKR